ncbi:hypothetical protein [Nocardia fluminea]|uniref:hypothetical protein n=1 Tax=Nocardia fluminea TaxID=134984 RepID=UPI003428CC79
MWGLQRDIQDDEPEPRTAANSLTVQDIMDRLAAEAEEEGRPSPVLVHTAPRHPITVEEAHTLMQRHRSCALVGCPAKREAYLLLVDRRIIVPRPTHGQLEPRFARG